MSRVLCVVLALLGAAASVRAQDSFLEAARASCLRSGGILDCVKYKVANLVHRIASTQRSLDLGPMRLVSIPKANTSEESMFLSRAATYKAAEPEVTQMFKYGLRQVEVFLSSHGLSLPLGGLGVGGPSLVYDDGSNTIGDERAEVQGRSRNLHLIVPLMIMVKLMSIKALLIPTLLGVAAIKKFIILTVMALPSIMHKLKVCKIVPHLVHYTPHHSHSHEFHDDYVPHHYDTHHSHHDVHSHDVHSHHNDIHRRIGQFRSLH
ncbi:uncharacterized protein LOC124358906 isoform X2 [Homalodisca vitripennis]|uniref:uncharacterized protein LOC124358906 isoform X2 n=1 Tax=Homalodisca vitripennis TaxID=197043 RepID=UPI001EEA748D|nr:uncharacterized protein LOC124358906 isoform X2 [Homalodisca vitripennis]